MNKKTTKKTTETVNSSAEYDSKREQNILLEKIYSEVKTVGEGHSVLSNKIDNLSFEVKEVKAELTTVKFAVMENSRSIKILDKRVEKIETKLDKVETRLDRVETKIDKVTENHEHRIERLEAAIS